VCIHCFDCSLVSTFTNETRFCHLLLIRFEWEIHSHLCSTTLKKSKPFSAFCAQL
jgi:hypothetical protein